MSTTFEEALQQINSRDNMRLKLMSIKTIGHHTPLTNLASYTTTRLKELGLVTSVFSRRISLHSPYDKIQGAPAFFTILVRHIKHKLPYLSADELKKFTKVDRYSMSVIVESTPAVRRYLNRYITRLRSVTNNTVGITSSDILHTGCIRLSISIDATNAQSYKVVRYIEQIVDALFTLHRYVILDNPTNNEVSDGHSVPDF